MLACPLTLVLLLAADPVPTTAPPVAVKSAPPPASEDEPPPVPSGMDLLYSDRVPILPSGEPMIALGLMIGQNSVVLRSHSGLQADYYDAGVHKRTSIPAAAPVDIGIKRAQPAKRRLYVDLEGIAWDKPERLDWALAGWRARGYPEVEALEEGTVLGIGGRVIDNREYRVVVPVKTTRQASAIIAEVYRRFGARAFTRSRLFERPWAELNIRVRGAPLGTATSFVRFVAPDGSPIQVDRVEHGQGYSWHGYVNRSYHGEIYVVVDKDGKLAAVNVLGSERILAGVVPSELFAESPPEALRAQAVAARNQMLAKLGRRHHDDPFHLCSSQHCQVYTGLSKEDPRATRAVRSTRGEVAFHHGKLVDTVYSSTCGGHTEDNDAVWGNAADPALRGRLDADLKAHPELERFADGITEENLNAWVTETPRTYCAVASKMRPQKLRWEKTFSARELAERLGGRYGWIGQLTSIEVDERGHGGRAISLRLVGSGGEATVVHELPIRRLFGNMNSGTFLVDHHRGKSGALLGVTFVGGGWGHGVGMCQIGAIGRAEAGHTYKTILGHYYNGATVERLYDAPSLRVDLSPHSPTTPSP